MDWRPAWWAGPPLLLLLLPLLLAWPGVSGQQEEDYFTLGHDYPHDVHDYYSDVDYGDYYHEFVPDVANATLHKCRCEGDQVWNGAACQDVATIVAIIDYWTKQRVPLNTSEFSSVVVGDVRCPEGHRKVTLDSNKGSIYEFSLLSSGELHWRDANFPNYCIDHILDHNGEPKSWMAHVCLPPPPVSLCCPEGQALLTNGTCYPSDAALNVPLSMEVEDQLLTWQIDASSVVTNLSCSPADTYYRRLSAANVSLVYDPRGVMLQWLPPTLTNLPIDRREYCVGVEVTAGHAPQHATLFCYKDRAAEHRELCHNVTCVRKCCPDHAVMRGVECIDVHDAHMEWTPTFHHLGSLSPGAPPPEDLALVHGMPICDSIFKMQPYESDEDRFYLLEDGTLMVPAFSSAFPATMYCLDNFIDSNHPIAEHPLVCFQDRTKCNSVQFVAYPALLAISCVFLTVTLLVYVSVPELHAKVHGKCLVSHVTALLFAYLCLISVQLAGQHLPAGACKLMGQ